ADAAGDRAAFRVLGEPNGRAGVDVGDAFQLTVHEIRSRIAVLLDVGRERDGPHVASPGPALLPGISQRIGLVEVLDIHHAARADVFEVAQTGDGARLLAGLGEDREEDSRQNRDNGDNYE